MGKAMLGGEHTHKGLQINLLLLLETLQNKCTQNEYSPALTLPPKTVVFVCRKKQVNGNCLTSTGT